jgi:hypothetical protein
MAAQTRPAKADPISLTTLNTMLNEAYRIGWEDGQLNPHRREPWTIEMIPDPSSLTGWRMLRS